MNSRASRLLMLGGLLCVAGCSEAHPNSLFLGVQLVTDLEAEQEFASIEVKLDNGQVQRKVASKAGYLTPERVADFKDLKPAEHRQITVRLLDAAGKEVLVRKVELKQSQSTTRTITLARSCIGVQCKTAGSACFGGACNDARCLDGSEAACGEPLCKVDEDCPATRCEQASCRFGACLTTGPAGDCDAGLTDAGLDAAVEAGVDAGLTDAGSDAGDPGPLRCDGGVCRLDAACASFSFDTHRYWLCELRQTYQAAKAFCADDGAHLAIIESAEESAAIGARIAFVTGIDSVASQHFMGIDDLRTQGKYEWIDDSPLTYQNWRKGEPNNKQTTVCEHEDCGTVYSAGLWNDACCASRLPFVCEADLP